MFDPRRFDNLVLLFGLWPLAKRSGISRSLICKYRRGESAPRDGNLNKITEATGLPKEAFEMDG